MGRSIVAQNKKAGFDVEVERRFEAGIMLTGDEIKSIREGRAQLVGGYVKLSRVHGANVPVLIGLHLSRAAQPDRSRSLLLHGREIREMEELLAAKGRAAVALALYLERGWAKVTVGVGRGRKARDKRDLLRRRDAERDARAALKERRRG